MTDKTIRIGGASGFWGDWTQSTPQLLTAGVDYVVYDYLAEITMSIMARARAKDANMGFAPDFVSAVLKPNLTKIARDGVKILSNAGGVNPVACGKAVRALVSEMGLDLRVAVITGDDLTPKAEDLAKQAPTEMFSGAPYPDPSKLASINAYIGAFAVAEALKGGADIVITGRCVDSALTLAACIHEFGWQAHEFDLMAAGSLAGHLVECGPQATGGNFTDWHKVKDGLTNIGYPIAEMSASGEMVITKPEGTGGMVSVGTVAEQMLYEIGDPQAYILPDVVCDFSDVEFEETGKNRVTVTGVKGRAPTDTYKVCATYMDGYRGTMVMNFYGLDAAEKAQFFADAAFERTETLLRASNAGEYTEKSVEIIGAESQYGPEAKTNDVREVALKIACRHPSDKGISLLFREVSGLALATPPGLSGFGGGRPKATPVVRLFSFLLAKEQVQIELDTDGDTVAMPAAASFEQQTAKPVTKPELPPSAADVKDVPLVDLAWGRSGDKGNKANIGIIARKPEYLPYIWQSLACDKVKARFSHFLEGDVERFYLPGSNAINYLLHDVLGGGGVASLRADPQGKGYAQLLLSAPIRVPVDLL